MKATEDFLHFFPLCGIPFNYKKPVIPAYLLLDSDRVFLQFTNTHTTGRVSKRTPPSTALLVPSLHYSAHLNLTATLLSIYLLSLCLIYDTGWGTCCAGGSGGHRYPNNTLHYLPNQTNRRHLHAICSITHENKCGSCFICCSTRVCQDTVCLAVIDKAPNGGVKVTAYTKLTEIPTPLLYYFLPRGITAEGNS